MKQLVMKLTKRVIIPFILAIAIIVGFPVLKIQAADNASSLEDSYLNTSVKYLYLGEEGKESYDFDINEEVLEKGATYSWLVNKEKGNQKSVSINQKTGLVTAKKAGIAYIQCVIKKVDGTVLHLEAKVIVRNAITKVEINNYPKSNSLTVGETMYFSYKIRNTAAGRDATTEAIVRWEILDDTTWSEGITEVGAIVPKKEGEFKIRAVCFYDEDLYERWIHNKTTRASYITASSDWVTIKVVSPEGEVFATNQNQLAEILKAHTAKQINMFIDKETAITIPEGDYSDINLVVKATKAVITNKGVFKQITINDFAEGTWNEIVNGNSIVWNVNDCILNVASNAKVKQILLGKETKVAKVSVEGSVKTICIDAPESEVRVFVGANVNMNADVTADFIQVNQKDTSTVSEYCFNQSSIDSTLLMNETLQAIVTNNTVNIMLIKVKDIKYDMVYGNSYVKDLIIANSGIVLLPNRMIPTVNTAIYASNVSSGQTLTFSTLTGYFKDSNNNEIPGMLKWNYPNTAVNETGGYTWTFIPAEWNKYTSVTGISIIYVTAKAKQIIFSDITATTVNKGDTLYASKLNGTFKNTDGNVVEGTITWIDPSTVLNSKGTYLWKFTPKDAAQYDVVTGNIMVSVN